MGFWRNIRFTDHDHDGHDDRFQAPDYLIGVISPMHSEQPDLPGEIGGFVS